MIDRMDSRRDTGSHTIYYIFNSCLRLIGKGYDHIGMVFFTPDRGAVLTVQRHVKNASTELLGHFRLQSQAFAHPHFNAAVVVTHRQ